MKTTMEELDMFRATRAFSENEASDGSTPATVFTAVYTEGGWRITDNDE